MSKKRERKSYTAIKCKCEERAVKRPNSLLRKVKCRKCGKIFKTNRLVEICFSCDKIWYDKI